MPLDEDDLEWRRELYLESVDRELIDAFRRHFADAVEAAYDAIEAEDALSTWEWEGGAA